MLNTSDRCRKIMFVCGDRQERRGGADQSAVRLLESGAPASDLIAVDG